jgi:hypothetical protein
MCLCVSKRSYKAAVMQGRVSDTKDLRSKPLVDGLGDVVGAMGWLDGITAALDATGALELTHDQRARVGSAFGAPCSAIFAAAWGPGVALLLQDLDPAAASVAVQRHIWELAEVEAPKESLVPALAEASIVGELVQAPKGGGVPKGGGAQQAGSGNMDDLKAALSKSTQTVLPKGGSQPQKEADLIVNMEVGGTSRMHGPDADAKRRGDSSGSQDEGGSAREKQAGVLPDDAPHLPTTFDGLVFRNECDAAPALTSCILANVRTAL